ncbi:PfkB family carbohydrate kinase [Tomitella fengzijianii]|uniref:Bifunctional hydroxymethylpyrimidine kinase/phosphomethylpyrimidine kinase n=1 Tax=Tomitella fengzijianii TaxID=2597660 RepID=A0A516X5P5_9ACTN|nr:PfkB family carbohydrate kinase [Tomitella fengzijianii]QDQ98376.1 bifunctional hydroxymethylpyrimidine kinase/phosphomethylpyrimidine kinase [Tomitella fengzijianii]
MIDLPVPSPGRTPPRALTIAGSDSGGGAGIQADMRTMAMSGVHACVAVAAVTVQNTTGVTGFHPVPPGIVAGQIRTVVQDIDVQAAKTGMVAEAQIIEAIVETCIDVGIGGGRGSAEPSGGEARRTVPLVVDPVCASMHGDPLLEPHSLAALRDRLVPLADLVTPNLDEVRLLTGVDVTDRATQRDAARALVDLGARWALVTGGHLRADADGPTAESTDLLYDGADWFEFSGPRVHTGDDHGGGDTLAAAITCALTTGATMPDSVAHGKEWVTRCLNWSYPLGAGHGPVSPLWRLQ